LRIRNGTVLLAALGLMSLAGCNFDTHSNNTAAASSASADSGSSGSTGSGASATLHWEMPTENTNGTPLTDLAGYTILYGESPESMNQWVQVNDVGATSYVINNLASGTWYFAVLSYTSAGANSALSNLVTKTVP
jgi:hypothetical protein